MTCLARLIDSLAIGGPALFVADAVAKATVLLCLAMIAAAVLRRSSAAVRHRLWALTLCGLLVLPALSWSLPGWRLPILPATTGVAGSRASRNRKPRIGSDTIGPPGRPRFGATRVRSAGRAASPGPATDDPGRSRAGRDPGTALESARMLLVWVMGFIAVALPALAGIAGNEWRRRQIPAGHRPGLAANCSTTLTDQLALRRRVELRTIPACR